MEGMSLTLLGLVRFDFRTHEWRMTELYNVFAGGTNECCDLLAEQIRDFEFKWFLGTWVSSLLLTVAVVRISAWYYDRKVIKDLKAEDKKWKDLVEVFDSKQNAVAHSVECSVCCQTNANVVFSPCNHMVMCVYCLVVYKRHADKHYQTL
jgi:hypothetical protein